MSKKPKTVETKKIAPLDVDRCQTEVPNGASFMTLGGVPGLVRCSNQPEFVLVEREPGEDGQNGAMTVCASCFDVFKKSMGNKVKVHSFTILRSKKGER